jgi:hypothetical protein
MPDLSAQSLQELRLQLNAAVTPAAVVPPAPMAVAPADFCSAYKTAKPLLQLALTILPFWPGPGVAAAAAITALMTVADKACPN